MLVSEGLRPADAALLDPARLAGVATEEGGADGHTAVMLRALGVPAVLGAPGLAHAIQPGDLAVVDGSKGLGGVEPLARPPRQRAPRASPPSSASGRNTLASAVCPR